MTAPEAPPGAAANPAPTLAAQRPQVALTLQERLTQHTKIARQSLKTFVQRQNRLLGRLQQDLQRTFEADTLRLHGEALKTQLQHIPRGASAVTVALSWLQDGAPLTIVLKPEQSPQANVQRLFQRARGLEAGRAVIARLEEEALAALLRAEALQAEWQVLLRRAARYDAAMAARAAGNPLDAVLPERASVVLKAADQWLAQVAGQRLRTEALPKLVAAERQLAKRANLPAGVQRFETSRGTDVLVGRSAAANDALVTRLLRGRDVWLHVRDQTGAHGVVRSRGKTPPTDADVAEAAVLTAHLSGIAHETSAEVIVAAGTGVRKVKGAAAGAVYVSGERSVRVRVDPAVIAGFYARRPPAAAS